MASYADNLATAVAAVVSAQGVYDTQNLTMPSDLAALGTKWASLDAAKAALAVVQARIAAAEAALLLTSDPGE